VERREYTGKPRAVAGHKVDSCKATPARRDEAVELNWQHGALFGTLGATSIGIATIWLYNGLAVGILPAIWVALWIPVVTRRTERTIEGGWLRAISVTVVAVTTILFAFWFALR